MKTATVRQTSGPILGRHVKAGTPASVAVSTLKVDDTIRLANGRNARVASIGKTLVLTTVKCHNGDADLAGHDVRKVLLTGRFEAYKASGRKVTPAKAAPKGITRNDALAKARAVKAAKKALRDALAL